jgi:hypothetical protein
MRAAVSGHTGAGKSTVAAMLGTLIREVRTPRAKKGAAREWAPLVAILNELGAAPVYQSAGFGAEQIVRCRTFNRTAQALASAAGGVAIVDSAPNLYLLGVRSYLDHANAELNRLGRPPLHGVPTSAWGAINDRYRTVMLTPGVDVIEVHNQAALVLQDGQGATVETEGYKPRGRNEGPIAPGFWLQVRGVRSASRERSMVVTVDASGKEVGAVRILPDFRGADDRSAALQMLRKLLRHSIEDLIRAGDEDAAAWQNVNEPVEYWPEAVDTAESGERHRIVETVKTLWSFYGLGTNANRSKVLRAQMLGEHFAGAVTEDDLLASPLSLLNEGLSSLQLYLKANHRPLDLNLVEPAA